MLEERDQPLVPGRFAGFLILAIPASRDTMKSGAAKVPRPVLWPLPHVLRSKTCLKAHVRTLAFALAFGLAFAFA